jgi:hypothetical protein
MSAFDGKPTPSEIETITENFLENLVGEGKKFADPEALARGKHEADKFVEDLKRQNAELREDMEKAAKVEELLEEIRNQKELTANKDPNDHVDPGDTSSDQMTPDALKALIETHVSERDAKRTATQNLAEVDKVLTEKYGEGAASILSSRADDLGMSTDEMKDLAARNPKAFLRLVGADAETQQSSTLLGNSQRSEGVQIKGAETRDFAFYQKIRRESKNRYHSVDVQKQMWKDAEAMGAAFYGN